MKKMFLTLMVLVSLVHGNEVIAKVDGMDKRDIVIQAELKKAYASIGRIKRAILELEENMKNLPCDKLKFAIQSINLEIQDLNEIQEKQEFSLIDLTKIKERINSQKNKTCGEI